MTEEEYFRKNYPDACYGDKPLSPYWDFFQDGVEFGERESEKKIAELEGKLKVETELNNRLGVAYREYEQLTKEQDEHLADLEKENAELKKLKRECETSLCRAEYQYNYEQLTKAKNLLQKVADVCGYPNYDIPVVLYSEIAENFLK